MLAKGGMAQTGVGIMSRCEVDKCKCKSMSMVQESCGEIDGLQLHGLHLWQEFLLYVF